MSCCAPSVELAVAAEVDRRRNAQAELLLASRDVGEGLHQTDLSVPGIHCGACMKTIEEALGAMPGVERARVNLSTKRVMIHWRANTAPPFVETLNSIGYDAHLYDAAAETKDGTLTGLIRALALAGFAASNIMLLSVSVWSGADAETRDLFHGISTAIALPALAYSGRIFFHSAWQSLRHGRTNMDVPISIGVLLAFGLSLYETIHHGPHAYFDAAISLLFFLLIGRTLDHMMRERARIAVKGLARLAARGALVQQPDGSHVYIPVQEIEPGMTILLAAGERVPVDARVIKGQSDIDRSLVSGESLPQPAGLGSMLQAGTLNLTGPLTIVAMAAAKDSFLAEMMRMMEAAESGRSGYRRIADRAARLYAPVVHLTALLTFAGWMIATGDVHRAITIAIAVLIITCPCALGLAVPMVQVVAARRLFEQGIMVKDGGALERLAEIDTVIFDKTGTLTLGEPQPIMQDTNGRDSVALAAAIAAHSRHPYSRALTAAYDASTDVPTIFDRVAEHPGSGIEAMAGTTSYRLGRAEWALARTASSDSIPAASVVLSENGQCLAAFSFEDRLRPDAQKAVETLAAAGFSVELLSGDREEPVRTLATTLGIPHVSRVSPGGKVAHIAAMIRAGRKSLMVGDGLNDAPALTAAHASMAPATAADVGRNAADLVFLRESLLAVPQAIAVARNAAQLVRENFALAIGYNVIAVPIAVLGFVTPLVAAIAMSLSSLLVVANALRLSGVDHRRQNRGLPDGSSAPPLQPARGGAQ
ncbi:MAG: cadmium-translocating P-type ATPase [Rhizobiales bacterium]|nr:cadmium-translocating P-type ATPase [Hyphomicrobiales bacterium]